MYTFDYGQSWTGVKADADGKATLVIDKSGQYNVRVRAVNNVGIPGEVSNTISVKIESSNGNNNNNNGNNGDNGNNGNNNNNNNKRKLAEQASKWCSSMGSEPLYDLTSLSEL